MTHRLLTAYLPKKSLSIMRGLSYWMLPLALHPLPLRFLSHVQKIESSLQPLPLLKDSQLELALLHSFPSFPKVSSCLLICHLRFIHDATKALISFLLDYYSSVVHCPFTEWPCSKAFCPFVFYFPPYFILFLYFVYIF